MYGEGVRSLVHIENPWLFACCSADYIQMIGFLKKHLGILLWKVKVKQPLRRFTTQRTTRSVLSGSAQVWLVLCRWPGSTSLRSDWDAGLIHGRLEQKSHNNISVTTATSGDNPSDSERITATCSGPATPIHSQRWHSAGDTSRCNGQNIHQTKEL